MKYCFQVNLGTGVVTVEVDINKVIIKSLPQLIVNLNPSKFKVSFTLILLIYLLIKHYPTNIDKLALKQLFKKIQ